MTDPTLIEKVLARNVLNIQKRVVSGEVITSAETALLEREAAKVATPDGKPEYALKKADLARALDISRQRLNGHVKKPGFPEPTPLGYHVETCRAWLLENGMVDHSDDDFEEARRRKTVAEANIAEMKQREMEGRLVDVDAVVAVWEGRVVTLRQKILGMTFLAESVRHEILDGIEAIAVEEYAKRGRELAENVEIAEVKRNL